MTGARQAGHARSHAQSTAVEDNKAIILCRCLGLAPAALLSIPQAMEHHIHEQVLCLCIEASTSWWSLSYM